MSAGLLFVFPLDILVLVFIIKCNSDKTMTEKALHRHFFREFCISCEQNKV